LLEPRAISGVMRHLLVAACLLTMAACSKSGGSPGPDGGVSPSSSTELAAKLAHPCQLLQRADAEAILDTSDLQQQEEPGSPGDAHCIWAVNGARGFVELRIQVPSRKAGFDRSVPDRLPVAGVGDRAYLQKRLSWGHIDVLKGEQTFFVQIEKGTPAPGHPVSPDQVQTETVALARTVASRM
jgi:hypothetical protein